MERFTELKKGRYIQYKVTGCYNDMNCKGDYTTGKSVDRLAELENKLERGQLVELPKLYQLSVGCKGTSSENYFVDEIFPTLTKIDGIWNLRYKNRLCAEGGRSGRELIGYFDTKEEAEARQKELEAVKK